jgi:crotonobetaine/carnitine-CoA ligase
VILSVTPLFHGNAWGSVMTALHAQATSVFPREFHGSSFWPLVHETGATVFFTLGTILAMLLTREPSELERTSRLRVVVGIGSAPIREQIRERFGVSDVAENYGATDSGCVAMTPLGEPTRPGSAGKAVPGVRIQIHDDDGKPLPPGEVGEIVVSAPEPRTVYYLEPELTAAAYRDAWFLTGDLGRLDEDGWLYFVDRKKDFIRHRSENVSSAWVEKILRDHPRVLEAAVIGIPHEVFGQEIMAFIVADGEVDAEELRAFASQRLAKFEVPHYWEFRDSLPKTPTQRIQKYRLREEAGALGKKLLG